MAALGGLEALVGGLEERTKKALIELIRAAFPFLRFGPVDTPKAENFQGYKITSTTASDTAEFSVLHGLGRQPYLMIPIADVTSSGVALVPLTVTRASDAMRLYVKTETGSTSKVFQLYVE